MNNLWSFRLLLSVVLAPLSTTAEEIRIGMLLPLSGSYASVGSDNREGAEVAIAELSESRITLVYGDSRTEPMQAISEFRRMVNVEKVVAVFAFRGPVGMAINPISKQMGVPVLGGVGNKKFALENEYAFQLWPPSDQEGKYIADQIAKRDAARVALVTAQDDWTDAVSVGFREGIKANKQNLVFDEDLVPSQSDFRTTVLKLKSSNPDAVFVNLSLSQIGPFIKQLREQKVGGPIFSNFFINKPDVITSAGAAVLEGVLFAEMDTDLPVLKKELRNRFDSSPSGATLSSYIGTMLLGQATKDLGETFTREEYYQSLKRQQNINTKNGKLVVDKRVVQFPMTLRVMRNGKAVIEKAPGGHRVVSAR